MGDGRWAGPGPGPAGVCAAGAGSRLSKAAILVRVALAVAAVIAGTLEVLSEDRPVRAVAGTAGVEFSARQTPVQAPSGRRVFPTDARRVFPDAIL